MDTTIEIKKELKKTKIGWTPEDWSISKLGQIATVNMGQSPDSKSYNTDGLGLYLIQGNADIRGRKSVPRVWTSEPTKKCNIGDILMTVRAPVGSVAKSHHNACIGRGMCSITSDNIDSEFLYQYMLSYEKSWKYLEQGSTFTAVNGGDIRNIKLPLPPLPEQQKIAEILSIWDKGIENTQNLIEQLKLRRKGLRQQVLTGKKRLSGLSDTWEEIKLGDITERITHKNTELNDNVVTISAQRGFVKQEDYFNKRVASKTLSGYNLIEKGDFAYNKSYSKGYPMGAFKRLDDLDKAVVTTLYICFSIKENVNSDFLLNYFEGGLMIDNLMKIAQEGGRAHGLLNISLGDFFSLKMKLPSIEEQIAIAEILVKADEEISLQQRNLDRLQSQKTGLMQQLLTGKTRITIN